MVIHTICMKFEKLIHDRTTVYNIGYHIVWAVKYRQKVLTVVIERSFKEILFKIAPTYIYKRNFSEKIIS